MRSGVGGASWEAEGTNGRLDAVLVLRSFVERRSGLKREPERIQSTLDQEMQRMPHFGSSTYSPREVPRQASVARCGSFVAYRLYLIFRLSSIQFSAGIQFRGSFQSPFRDNHSNPMPSI